MAEKMTLYNLEACPGCKAVREKLGEMQITYTCANVHPDRDKRKYLLEATGQSSVPVLVHKDKKLTSVADIMQYLAEIKE
jgi:glutaredoxin